ncbi:hypothetical protein QVD17_09018 [Tagetes erecta]|uniref:FAR1 domain-containing protein n=1 Tax=Tagetes erecta TaxID=13708 RepID=A0AAD8KZR3_TARER|nr:hypothetical protein QVD17_09018 [Tagetes erecta]
MSVRKTEEKDSKRYMRKGCRSSFGRKCCRLAKEHRARFYILRRCIIMLLCFDSSTYVPRGIEKSSPNSSNKYYIPDVLEQLKPKVRMTFDDMDHAYSHYCKYAVAAGFNVRKGTDSKSGNDVIKLKYYLCSKEGFNQKKTIDTLEENAKQKVVRANYSKRTACEAHIRVELVQDKWKIYKFVEKHNHPFVSDEDMHFLASSRNLSELHKHMIQSMTKINIGLFRAFNVMRTIFGGFEEVGISKVYCKKYKREINLFINEFDAEMMVENLMKKKEHLHDVFFYTFFWIALCHHPTKFH